MAEIADMERNLLETVRLLPPAQQEAVLNFARSLSGHTQSDLALAPIPLSLQQLAKLPVRERNQLLAPYVTAMAQDFENDPELTEFSVLDDEDWED